MKGIESEKGAKGMKGVKKGVMGYLWSNFPVLLFLLPLLSLPPGLLRLPGLEV